MIKHFLHKLWLTILSMGVGLSSSAITVEEFFTAPEGVDIEVTNDKTDPWKVNKDGELQSTMHSKFAETKIAFTNHSNIPLLVTIEGRRESSNTSYGLRFYDGKGECIDNIHNIDYEVKTVPLPANETLYIGYSSSGSVTTGSRDIGLIKNLTFAPLPSFVQDNEATWYYLYNNESIDIISFTSVSSIVELPSSITHEGKDYPITRVRKSLFQNNKSIKSIVIPESIESIEQTAFEGCTSIESLTLPFIGKSREATSHEALLGYIFGENSNISGNYAAKQTYFSSSVNAQTYYLPLSLTKVEFTGSKLPSGAFSGCTSITDIVLKDGIKDIESYAFYDCKSLHGIIIPNGVTSIKKWSFGDCSSLQTLNIPNSVTSIGEYAFSNCSYLQTINIPNSVTSIGESAFRNCSSLQTLNIPNSVSSIGKYAFYYCSNLQSVFISEGVKTIGNYAFAGCSQLEILSIPSTVTSLDAESLKDLKSLKVLTLPYIGISKDVTSSSDYTTLGYLFLETSTEREGFTATKQVQGNGRIRTFQIPSSLAEINVLGGYIRKNAFENCTNIKTIVLSNNVGYLNASMFVNCSSLEKLSLPYYYNSRGGTLFGGTVSLKELIITGGEILVDNCFYSFESLEKVTLIGLEKIRKYTFENCFSLKEIQISDNCTMIDTGAFQHCMALETIKLPGVLKTIGNQAFYDCQNLYDVIIPAGIESIGENAFSKCLNLRDLYYCGDESQWNELESRPTLTNTRIHFKGNTHLGEEFFIKGLQYVVTDSNQRFVMVAQCENEYIGDVYIPLFVTLNGLDHKVIGIDNNAFLGCDNLTAINYAGSKLQWKKLLIGKGNEILTTIPINYNSTLIETEGDNAANYLYTDKQVLGAGELGEIQVKLLNEQDVTGFQFEIELPVGIELRTNGEKYSVELSTGRTTKDKHNIFDVTKLANGRYLVICSSTSNSVFMGNDGEVLSIKLNVASELEDGDYTITLHNIAISTPAAVVYRTKKLEIPFAVDTIIPGDADGNKSVTKNDVVAMENYLLGNTPERFSLEAADINKDGRISIEDLTRIIDILINPQSQSIQR